MQFRLLKRRWSDKTVIRKTELIVHTGYRFRWIRLHSGMLGFERAIEEHNAVPTFRPAVGYVRERDACSLTQMDVARLNCTIDDTHGLVFENDAVGRGTVYRRD